MFSLEAFYKIVSKNLIEPLNFTSFYFSKFGSTTCHDLDEVYHNKNEGSRFLFFWDQEPVSTATYMQLCEPLPVDSTKQWTSLWMIHTRNYACPDIYFNRVLRISANSEHSQEKNDILKAYDFQDWYYFFHGFAALDWYRNIQYLPPIDQFDKVFITFNNLITDKRSYRLDLVARLIDKKCHERGYISLGLQNRVENIKSELLNSFSRLTVESKKIITKHLIPNKHRLIIDTENFHGALSANDDLDVLSKGLWHLVTETVYYDDKIHLTEKIFKPIVARRPFILVSAPGNLAYLKGYGFKTFDRWIDESYDNEPDPGLRIIKIVNEVEKLCQLTDAELTQMYKDMQEILDYNFQWFYGGFKKLIIDELVDNFKRLLITWNAGKDITFPAYVDYSMINFEQVKLRLAGNSS